MTIDDVVKAYIDCGERRGFFRAEMVLMKHLPKGKPFGNCSDVPESGRAAFAAELGEA